MEGIQLSDFKGPSVRERVKALHDHVENFEMVAEFPRAGVHERFLKEWALAIAYVEGKVFRCWRSFESSIKGILESEIPNIEETELADVMDPLVESLLLHARVTKSAQRMSQSSMPSVPFMDMYRAWNGVKHPGTRAANGELASRYDQRNRPVPPNFGVIDDQDLEPMARLVYEWIAIPVHRWFAASSKHISDVLPQFKVRKSHGDDRGLINAKIIGIVTNLFMYIMVTLILVAPIATFNVVESQTARIVIMPLFCLLLVALAQFIGSKSQFIATLATAYFQAMVIYVGTTSDRQASR